MMSGACLMFYPWSLTEPSGALVGLKAYAGAARAAGYEVDCCAPGGARLTREPSTGYHLGVFERTFGVPEHDAPLTDYFALAGKQHHDCSVRSQLGSNEVAFAAVGGLAAVGPYEVVAVNYTRCHPVRRLLPKRIRTVLHTYDLDAQVLAQEAQVFGGAPAYSLEGEVARMRDFDLVTAVGPDDAAAIRAVDSGLPLIEAPFGFTSRPVARNDSEPTILWLSSAAPFHRISFEWFWTRAWPLIRSAHRDCRLVMAGRISAVAAELGAATDYRVSLQGVVDDPAALYSRATVVSAPYYYGGGVKVKILEALAHGLPVATTTHGLSNTHLSAGRDVAVADDAHAYAEAILTLLEDAGANAAMREAGLRYIERWHAPDTALSALRAAYAALSNRPSRCEARPAAELVDLLRAIVPWAIHRCHELSAVRVAIFGAGSHTATLLPIWTALGGPAVSVIIVSGQPATERLKGIPVVQAADISPREFDAIVLSSRDFEREMASACAARWPDLPVVRLWEPPVAPTVERSAACRAWSTVIPGARK